MYDIFLISSNVNSFLKLRTYYPFLKLVKTFDDAKRLSLTEMFWVVWDDLIVEEDFNFDYTVPNWDKDYIHVFKNGSHYDGICLFPKKAEVSKRELNYRFFSNKKEVDIVASNPKPYDYFEIETYDQYLKALETSSTEMFWMSSPNIKVYDDFDLGFYFSHHNSYDRNQNHVFVHKVKDNNFYNGLFLLSKNKPVSKREIEHRHIVEKKEWDVVATGPVEYDKFIVDTYEDYTKAIESSRTEMFWMIPKEVEVIDSSIFDLYFDHSNVYDRGIHHSFKHKFRNDVNFNGINLVSKQKELSTKEIEYRFIVEKKEYETVATKLKKYDVVFISYNEPNADENYERLLKIYPSAKRVHKVKGIHQAHIKAAELSETENFWVVDGDALIVDDFNFSYEVPVWDKDVVHIWYSLNPINDLKYGYGGVKLLPRKLTLSMNVNSIDMTTSISKKIKVIEEVSNYTAFNTDPFNTWKSAFRESVKLLSNSISNADKNSMERYSVWATVGADRPFGEHAIKGALDAKLFVDQNGDLVKINDFEFLYERFNN